MSTPLERDRRLARLRLERQRARQAEARRRRRRRRLTVLGSLGAVLLVVVIGAAASGTSGGRSTAGPTATPTSSAEQCVYRADGTRNSVVKTRPKPPTGAVRDATATLVLNEGTVTFTVDGSRVPCAATSLAFLAAHKYYDGTSCDRLTTGGLQFLQCGGKPVKGTGPGYAFPDEGLSPSTKYPAGTVGLVNHAKNSNGAELFLCYGPSDLPPDFVVVGHITTGLDILMQIAAAGASPPGDGVPLRPTTIRSLRTSSS